jgi:hypothetical protein
MKHSFWTGFDSCDEIGFLNLIHQGRRQHTPIERDTGSCAIEEGSML